MDIPASRWYSVIPKRRSRRQFDSRPIATELLTHLHTACVEFRPFPHARAVLITESPERVFKGAVGPYGKIKGAPAFIAFIGNMDSPYVQEEIGYTGEGIILEATALHLATCWVGGFFRPEVAGALAEISESEKVLSVTPIGYTSKRQSLEEKLMTGFGRSHRRKRLSGLVTGLEEADWPEWIKATLEAARLAPSAVNRQPWRFYVEPDSITVSVGKPGMEFNVAKRLDCGIAMLHIEVAALNYGMSGKWEFLEAPQVARFRVR